MVGKQDSGAGGAAPNSKQAIAGGISSANQMSQSIAGQGPALIGVPGQASIKNGGGNGALESQQTVTTTKKKKDSNAGGTSSGTTKKKKK